ncbi:probable adenylate kinase 7, mitochondrial isoform X1 [Phalaenopsis equestris]|uniref:probable adenylate kinase 7, mitochondrial isoform X1 n=1 Tax=Phalaenopsis equestris TaxID=78828 RepID=UPI0009E5B591|nr:probable adenylate kinase 7, mitochondrial isoform X1 [Phalaenopsis equestris]
MVMLCPQSAFASARLLARRIFSTPLCRSFGSAAAVEAVYDSEWDDDERFGNRSPPMQPQEAADTWGQMKERSVQWVFMGSPSSQKRHYATRVAKLLDVPYISMGTLVRQELNPHSSLYTKIASSVNEGKLVTEEVIFGLLSKRLEEGYYRGETGFILDGIPKTCTQAELLDQVADVDLVVNFKSSEDSFVKKHIGNDVCAHCGKIFDIFNSQSTRLNPCLGSSTNHSKLNDSGAFDMEKSCLEKLQMHSIQKKQLEDYYRQQKKLLDFRASGGPVETWRCLLAALHLQQTHAARLSQKLFV